ncbi:MAG: M1 family metallopeptidase [bacterium]|nr:M1 family metallopeptidase [bacterium]
MKKSVTRLFNSFKTENYNLSLELNPDKSTFVGRVIITGRKTGRPSQKITFHQKDLKITSANIIFHDKKGVQQLTIDRINTHNKYDELRLHCTTMVYPGKYEIEISFTGKITDPMNGLYPCYFTHNGKAKKLLATQFESHHAREVFPCIDEPEAKASFDLTLSSPTDGSVLANTPIKHSVTKNGLTETIFETTPTMSTYLLAFVYGHIEFLESTTKNGTIIRTYATPDKVDQTQFALDTAVKCLEFYENYFDIAYPLPKLDMIALPDFASGAMENWGLITYREQTLLVDPKSTSLSTKQYVAMVVAHELAHQWFGNLVTMNWWTDLWLNEGFASWIEYLACDHLFPDWQMWTQFASAEQQPAFRLDALQNTHPIEVPINHPDEIRTIFDTISYSKGASVIHMLFGYLGEKDFKEGLRYYLKSHQFGNAQTTDLWAALEKTSGKAIKQFMHAWITLPGYPVVHVEKSVKGTNLSQQRFYMQKPAKSPHALWPVPILNKNTAIEKLENQSIVIPELSLGKINRGQRGFYRTIYDDDNLAAVIKELPHLDAIDRLGLMADSFETAKAGYSSTEDAFKLLDHFSSEDNAAVWDIIASNVVELRRVMDDEDIRDAIKPFIRKLVAAQLNRLGWEEKSSDSYFDKLLRPTILGLASGADEKTVVDQSILRFESAKTLNDIHPDLRSIVLNTAARRGNKKTYAKLLKFHNSSDSSEEQTILAAALTSFEQTDLISESLALITTETVRRQDAMYWLAYSFMNRFSKQTTWLWMQENWQWLEDHLGTDLSFYRTPIYVARSFSNPEFIKEYDEFFEPKISPSLERSIKQGREMLQWQIDFRQREKQKLLAYLKSKI